MADTQIVVKHFCSRLNIKTNGVTFKRFLGQAKSLLNSYSADDIIKVINYVALHPPKNLAKITSFGILPYIMEETLPLAIAEEHRFKQDEFSEIKQVETNTNVVDLNKGKYDKGNNDFANRGRVTF